MIISKPVLFRDFNKSGKTLVIEFFTDTMEMDDFNKLKENLNISFAGMMEELSLEMNSGTSNT